MARLMTTEEVVDELQLSDDFDVDEPMMPGSDDEFSDLENVDDDDDTSSTPIAPPNPSSTSTSLPSWSATLTPANVAPFTSHVGPKVTIPESPSDTFQLMFTPSFLDAIVEQTNLYAKEVMGEDKYESWEKVTQEELKAYLGFCVDQSAPCP